MTSGDELPLVSIITATYNRADYLEETIESVLNQNYPRLDYIVLDDGSTDNSREILKKYEGRLTWETHPNMGETRTVNKGWRMSKGQIVASINSDDPLLPGAVRTIVEFMQTRPEVLVAYPDWNEIGPRSEILRHMTALDYDYLHMLKRHHCIVGPGAFIRREAFDLAGVRDPDFKYVADLEYWLRLGLHGPLARVPQTLATFRVHPSSASVSAKSLVMAEEHVRLMEKYFALPGLSVEVQAAKAEAWSWAYYTAGHTCGRADRKARRRYFIQSFRAFPRGYVTGNYGRWRSLLYALLPWPFSAIVSKTRRRFFGAEN